MPIAVYLQPGANALQVAAAVKETMERISKSFPVGLRYDIPFDTTRFVEVSIEEVAITFVEAIVLVVLVVFLFLQSVRAMIIPVIAIPVSIIGTFAGMFVLGFSINLLTLFGLVLAIGIVVDDAIVVLENVERIMSTQGKLPRAAAIQAMQEVTGPIIAIVLVLCAVFIPVSFLGGLAGELYRQFAVTIAVSVVISGIVALTLTPALAALLLKPAHGEPWAPFARFNRFFAWVTARYTGGVGFLMRRTVVGIAGFVVVLGLVFALFQRIPGSLVPAEDQGYVFMVTILPPAASISRTREVTKEATAALMKNPAVANVVTFSGFDLLSRALKTNSGISFVTLKDWSVAQRSQGGRAQPGAGALRAQRQLQGRHRHRLQPAADPGHQRHRRLRVLSCRIARVARSTACRRRRTRWWQAANKRPELRGVSTTFTTAVPQYRTDVDREKARALGIPINTIFDTMQSSFGSLYVNDFSLYGRTYRVSLSSEADFREKPDDLRHVFVRSDTGAMVPLNELVSFKRVLGPDTVDRFNIFPAAKILGSPAPGFSSGQAIAAMQQVVATNARQRLHASAGPDRPTRSWRRRARARWASSSA